MGKIIRKIVFLAIIAIVAVVLYAYDSAVIPTEDLLLTNETRLDENAQCITQKVEQPLDRHGNLDVTTWNLYKQNSSGWDVTLKQLAERSDLLLLQEAKYTADLKSFVEEQELYMLLARAFTFAEEPIGVMNLSRDRALSSCVFRKAEPYIHFPKSMLISYYLLSDATQLLAVNIHSINFTWGLDEYKAQLSVVKEALLNHTGPIIFAGDMNTWSEQRSEAVAQLLKNTGLIEAIPNEDSRTTFFGHRLDHIYYRDLELVKAESIITESSDHNPVKAYFRLQKKYPSKKLNSAVTTN
ncbi:endonuclease/exonuclease/phosphatase family protein [Shewanella marinintestina]|uniref:endonuclease/exonuclease/phosphatase family protein n=1 Tax=Shewanella marinintestina TaxID=190305 RepID=UPI00200BA4E8|nr:endonuclease/exonuclease/phosphatase family protein [Shewanella marinintestina]MCL1144498.1 endonuclease/exonuclease/phosphatase family protein [Shewanella marinintestina]